MSTLAPHERTQADGVADYYAAETLLIQETFQRQLGCQVSLLSALRVRARAAQHTAPRPSTAADQPCADGPMLFESGPSVLRTHTSNVLTCRSVELCRFDMSSALSQELHRRDQGVLRDTPWLCKSHHERCHGLTQAPGCRPSAGDQRGAAGQPDMPDGLRGCVRHGGGGGGQAADRAGARVPPAGARSARRLTLQHSSAPVSVLTVASGCGCFPVHSVNDWHPTATRRLSEK